MVQGYIGSQLQGLHNHSVQSVTQIKDKMIAFLSGSIFIMALPYLHIGVVHLYIWVPGKPKIQTNSCSCSCFDTVFKGSYENPGKTRYKHVYFNATSQTFKIWIVTVLFILMAYESIKYLLPLLRRRNIRKTMFILCLINIYPHYYSWWSYFSYYNEDFYKFFNHHMLFTITEVISTCIVLNLCDKRNEIISWKILAIVSINMMHVLVAGIDQFVSNVIYREGHLFQDARDIGLMIPDCLHVVIPLWELYNFAKRRKLKIYEICYKAEMILFFIFISMGTLVGKFL